MFFCRLALLFSILYLQLTNVTAADRYFTNVLGGDFTNKTLWMTGVIPVLADNANFTNNTARQISWTMNATNANAFFNPTLAGITYTQAIGSSTWYVTNQFIVAQNNTSTAVVTQVSGTLVVTNAGGIASMVIGRTGDGTFNLNGGTVIADHLYVTNGDSSTINFNGGSLTLLNDSTFETNSGFASLIVGGSTTSNATLNIRGGIVYFGSNVVVGGITNTTAFANISGTSTVVTNMGHFYIGITGMQNEVTMSNGATMYVDDKVFIGDQANSTSNSFIVTGTGTSFKSGLETTIGGHANYNTLIVSNNATYDTAFIFLGSNVDGYSNFVNVVNGGVMTVSSFTRVGVSGSSNTMVVSDAGSELHGTTINVGANSGANDNLMVIKNGGLVSNSTTSVGFSGDDNTLLITDSGSTWTNTGTTFVGRNGANNTLIISNGGAMYSDYYVVASNTAAIGNEVIVTGPGSLLWALNTFDIGSNTVGSGKGLLRLLNWGTLETPAITNGFAGTGNITNEGGVFQFSITTPTIQTNAGGAIVVTNGTIAYRNVDNAPVYITNQINRMTFFGSNTFMLNNATNFILSSYIFTNGLGGTNYAHLALINGNSRWQATNTLIGATSSMLVSNTSASTFGLITNAGTVKMAGNGTTLTNQGNLVLIGSGAGGAGSLINLTGTNTVNGPILLGGSSSIGSDSGKLILQGTLTNNAFLLTVTNAGTSTLSIRSLISGTGGLVHSGNGTLSLASSNSFSGNITNIAGTLSIDQNFAISGMTGSAVVNGGTLLFNASVTNTTVGVVLNGGTIQEVDTNVSLGALTVSANSIVQLGSGGGIGRLTFANGTNTVGSGAKLTIYGWSWNSALSGGSDDLIFFTSTSFETASFLNNVTFFGTGGGARVLSSGELVPITPEPTTLTGAFMLLGLLSKRLLRFKRWSHSPNCPP